ncbi:MAG TPA: amidohydrolase family protein [Bryobacteraceae bacterium]|nr:amidohydrolase family protein [Bryobacteraceae bacterium]
MNCFGRNVSTGASIEVSFGAVIESVAPAPETPPAWLAPGWIDLQVNGFAGVDYNTPSTPPEEIDRSLCALFATGVTRLYPTVITGSPQLMEGALRNLARSREQLPNGDVIEGFHVEGPFISPDDGPRGAHPRQWVRPPDLDEYRRWQDAAGGRVRMVTLAPEWPEASRFIEGIVSGGVVAAIGHTNANASQIRDAVSAGATISTHLGNGAHAVLPRHPNYIWDQLAEDRLMAGFIVDGVHLPVSFLKAALRAKTLDRSILVTDAATPSGAAPGRYRFGEFEVELTPDNRVVLPESGKLAGSALRMDRGVENLMRLADLQLADAVRLATVNPARACAIGGRMNGLVSGDRADLVEFRLEGGCLEVLRTWLGGREVWRAGEEGVRSQKTEVRIPR